MLAKCAKSPCDVTARVRATSTLICCTPLRSNVATASSGSHALTTKRSTTTASRGTPARCSSATTVAASSVRMRTVRTARRRRSVGRSVAPRRASGTGDVRVVADQVPTVLLGGGGGAAARRCQAVPLAQQAEIARALAHVEQQRRKFATRATQTTTPRRATS